MSCRIRSGTMKQIDKRATRSQLKIKLMPSFTLKGIIVQYLQLERVLCNYPTAGTTTPGEWRTKIDSGSKVVRTPPSPPEERR